MKAVLYSAPREFAVGDVDAVEPGPRDVRIRVHQTGLCGTDKHIHEGDFIAEFPLVPGHEIVGTVESTGGEVTSVSIGQWVTVNPNMSCGHCDQCRRGRQLLCRNLTGIGSNSDGGFAELITVPADAVFDVEGLDPDVAVFAEPAACALHGLETLGPRPGTTALVLGSGATGLLLAAAAGHRRRRARDGRLADRAPARAAAKARHRLDGADRARPAGCQRPAPRRARPRAASTTWSRRPGPPASAPAAWS